MQQEQVRDRKGSNRSPTSHHSPSPMGLITALSEGLSPEVVPGGGGRGRRRKEEQGEGRQGEAGGQSGGGGGRRGEGSKH